MTTMEDTSKSSHMYGQPDNTSLNRLSFDEKPITINSKSIETLSDLIQGEGFKKKNLNLVYRRSYKT